MILTQHILKCFGSIFPRKNLVTLFAHDGYSLERNSKRETQKFANEKFPFSNVEMGLNVPLTEASIDLMTRRKLILPPSFLFLTLILSLQTAKAGDLAVVERWLATNANTQSLKVDFVQSKALKALKKPLSQEGTLWLDYRTNQFRWQLGSPAKTIVVSQGQEKIAVMRTPLKRVEFRESGGTSKSAPGLSTLSRGFPKNLADFQKEYRILKINPIETSYEIITQPLGADAEGVSRFRFVIDKQRYLLKGIVIDLKDGSTVTTTFQKVDRNPVIQANVFRPDLSGYTQTKFRQG